MVGCNKIIYGLFQKSINVLKIFLVYFNANQGGG